MNVMVGMCPSCNGRNIQAIDSHGVLFYIRCADCGCTGGYGRTIEDAVLRWNFIPRVCQREEVHNNGTWRVGNSGSCVVSDVPNLPGRVGSGEDDVKYFGGYLIAESVSNENVTIIAQSNRMFEIVKDICSLVGMSVRERNAKLEKIDNKCRIVMSAVRNNVYMKTDMIFTPVIQTDEAYNKTKEIADNKEGE